MNLFRYAKKDNPGQALVEFCFVLVILLLLFCFAFDLSREINYKLLLNNVASDAVRMVERDYDEYDRLLTSEELAAKLAYNYEDRIVINAQQIEVTEISDWQQKNYYYHFWDATGGSEGQGEWLNRPSYLKYKYVSVTVSYSDGYVTPLGGVLSLVGNSSNNLEGFLLKSSYVGMVSDKGSW